MRSDSAVRLDSSGFDFTDHVRRLCEDVAQRVPDMHHIEVGRVAFAFAQTRKRVSHGLYASLTPMRFEDGAEQGFRRGRKYAVQKLLNEHGEEYFYILTLYLPRFQNMSFDEKLVTIFHELWHINPEFNGDLRRHPGRCYQHTHSQAEYDAQMAKLSQYWLSRKPPESLHAFLRDDFQTLQRRFGRVFGRRIPHPKLLPLP